MKPHLAFAQGFVAGIRPFGPAFHVLLATLITSTAAIMLGILCVYASCDAGLPLVQPLTLAGEMLMLAGGLVMLSGSIRVWVSLFRNSFSRHS